MCLSGFFGEILNRMSDLLFAVMVVPVGMPHSFVSGVGSRLLDGASSCNVCVEHPESSTACCAALTMTGSCVVIEQTWSVYKSLLL